MVNPDKVYVGKPCPREHDGTRWKCDNRCVDCSRSSDRKARAQRRLRLGGIEPAKLWRDNNRARSTWAHARRRAKDAGIPFEITVEDIPSIPDVCPVLGIPLSFAAGYPKDSSPSLDRIIPKLGYVPGNIHWISFKANAIKRDASAEELRRVAAYFTALEAIGEEASSSSN